ncbi:hypothetical protein Val02_82100 [Virgisporangium aliadipatigenens]|uniref:Uncharacterized protein n=1 Tax=Virgisporangium aliadipatigenens TaxID=741659 RepID=A0A8J4DV02_9ACTN|nr:hypothetical protein [Virgisporangium aliadipatigenens]GIJ51324.1 hypothetical protein Val02_82100 [Virgisporangium aliadipatigenens]
MARPMRAGRAAGGFETTEADTGRELAVRHGTDPAGRMRVHLSPSSRQALIAAGWRPPAHEDPVDEADGGR